jgi:hypothetical protein
MTDPALVVTNPEIKGDSFIFEGIDTDHSPTDPSKPGPMFTVSEVSKFFFGRSPHWVRWRERKGFFTLDGKDVSGHRTETGARAYTLGDVEMMSHALAQNGAINGSQLNHALVLVKTCAHVHGYL